MSKYVLFHDACSSDCRYAWRIKIWNFLINIFNEVMRLQYFWFHFQHSKIQFNQEVNFIFIQQALYSIE